MKSIGGKFFSLSLFLLKAPASKDALGGLRLAAVPSLIFSQEWNFSKWFSKLTTSGN